MVPDEGLLDVEYDGNVEVCPFCWSENAHVQGKQMFVDPDSFVYWVACPSCGASGPVVDDDVDGAVSKWNAWGTMSLMGDENGKQT